MIYLGEQKEALRQYSSIIKCWLAIKLRGRKSTDNPSGHLCEDVRCEVCCRDLKPAKLNKDFVRLFTQDVVDALITKKPKEIITLHGELEQQYRRIGYTVEEFHKEGKKLFVQSGYEAFFIAKGYNYKLARWLNTHTCTYCNRSYIFVFVRQGANKGIVPQFDHWFTKKSYPLLALSFYNLIPSCGLCNSSIKSDQNFNLTDHLHPYVDQDITHSFHFSYIAMTPNEYQIVCISKDDKSKKTVEDLELKMLYRGHSNKELKDLIKLRYKYSDNYLNILLNKTFDHLEVSLAERYRLIFGIEIDPIDYHKRPFSKFKNDIIKELLSINN